MHEILSSTDVSGWVCPAAASRAVAGLVTLAVLVSLAACGSGETDGGWAPEPWVSSAGVPYTQSPFLRLVGDSSACLVDSYETQVVCGGPAWREVKRFGREGGGPGEYSAGRRAASRWRNGERNPNVGS